MTKGLRAALVDLWYGLFKYRYPACCVVRYALGTIWDEPDAVLRGTVRRGTRIWVPCRRGAHGAESYWDNNDAIWVGWHDRRGRLHVFHRPCDEVVAPELSKLPNRGGTGATA